MKQVSKRSHQPSKPKSSAAKHYDLEHLNAVFTPLSFRERLHLLYAYFSTSEVLVTSSFGTQAVFLLHLIHQLKPSQRIYFINTGFHFPETLAYKNQLEKQFQLSVEEIHPDPEKHQFSAAQELWHHQANRCCFYNKVQPLEAIKEQYRVWISGVMGFQTPHRQHLQVFEELDGLIKFHPFIDIDEGELLFHLDKYQLPRHPLEAQGFGSVGCHHCTQKGVGRSGRWVNQEKTECGLHLPSSKDPS